MGLPKGIIPAGSPVKPGFGLSGDVHPSQIGPGLTQARLSSCRGDPLVFSTAGRVISSSSAVTTVPFDSFAPLSRPGQAAFNYHRRESANLRVGIGAFAARVQDSGLWVCRHAGACSSTAQRTAAGCFRRWKCPTQAKGRLVWATRQKSGPATPVVSAVVSALIATTASFWFCLLAFVSALHDCRSGSNAQEFP
jgi:hypothetical protein